MIAPAETIAKDPVWSQMTIAKNDNCKISCLVPKICAIAIVFFSIVWFLASLIGVYSRRVIDLYLNGNGLV